MGHSVSQILVLLRSRYTMFLISIGQKFKGVRMYQKWNIFKASKYKYLWYILCICLKRLIGIQIIMKNISLTHLCPTFGLVKISHQVGVRYFIVLKQMWSSWRTKKDFFQCSNSDSTRLFTSIHHWFKCSNHHPHLLCFQI